MKIAISIVLFDSPLDILKKNIYMLSKQDFLDDKSNTIEIFFCERPLALMSAAVARSTAELSAPARPLSLVMTM